jgi:Transposase DDE domain group 1
VGDAESGLIRLSFNPQLRVEFRGATVTSDAGLLLPRELDERLGLRALIERYLSDPRTGRNAQFSLADLFRQSIYSRLAGYEDTNDAERLAEDPTFRMLASRERRDTSVALTSTLHWFEADVLAEERNYRGLTRLNTELVQHPATRSPSRRVTLDIDSSESPVHGSQEQSAYNGHFESVCYHPLFVFNPEADCLAAKLRPGNVHSAEGWDEVLLPIIDGIAAAGRPWWSGRTRHSPCRRSTRRWNTEECGTRSGFQPMMSWSGTSRIYLRDLAADRVTPHWSAIGASSIRRRRGTGRDA